MLGLFIVNSGAKINNGSGQPIQLQDKRPKVRLGKFVLVLVKCKAGSYLDSSINTGIRLVDFSGFFLGHGYKMESVGRFFISDQRGEERMSADELSQATTTEQQADEIEGVGIDKRVLGFTTAHTSSCTDPDLVDSAARVIQFILSITASNKKDLLEKVISQLMEIVRGHIRSGIDGMTLEELCSIAAPGTKTKRARPPKQPKLDEDGNPVPKRAKKQQTNGKEPRIGEDGRPVTDQ